MLRDLYWSVRNYFFPQYRWLTCKLGRGFVEKEDVIRITLFESLVDFWENDDGEETLRQRAVDPQCAEHAEAACNAFKEFSAAYGWIKNDREIHIKEIDSLYGKIVAGTFPQLADDDRSIPTDEQVAAMKVKIDQLEEDLEKIDSTYLGFILENRAYLWS